MAIYQIIKYLHIGAAMLSVTGFLLRGYWMMTENQRLSSKLTRVLPHIIDSLLFGAAIGLLVMLKINPFMTSWLALKIVLLACYIVTGTIALKHGKTKSSRLAAFALSLIIICAIFASAILKPELV